MIKLLGFCRSPFRDFESYLRNVVGLDEEDIQLVLKQYDSHFIIYELTQEFIQFKIFQTPFILSVVIQRSYKLKMMILV